ncbi:TetR/AcrR family transcriptional regulator [Kribbella sp.]|uniref:TetR/AcrR family transcriptional regulator n=1 Tax=Kribbella sp. TaxID=1871183 RepID=UPI002D2A465E|nr:TetR/AcrR family transcriptional regulator [Kribbella sp.]HZX01399.1 TetR/AcrR family transcriptional regulator [Kribbella sp.]
MPRELSAYHRQVAATNRAAILDAAADLFLEAGYDSTSLARVAERAGVSRATLFKQFPTKAELFEATLLSAGGTASGELVDPSAADFSAGLVTIGLAYVELLNRPRMEDLIRTLIGEGRRFPELQARTFDLGTLPVMATLGRYLRAANAAGTATVDDPGTAAAQFLGMISTIVFWPRLIHGGYSLTAGETRDVVQEATRTIVARFGN